MRDWVNKLRKRLCVLPLLFAFLTASVSAAPYDVDSGFRPNENGFAFINYGERGCSDPLCVRSFPVVNLTVEEMVRLFGRDVCMNPASDEPCRLSQVASVWMKSANDLMSNGHCEGISILAALIYEGKIDPNRFGAAKVSDLILNGNQRLQREIAYHYATQLLTETLAFEETPIELLRTLIHLFRENEHRVVQLGLYRRDTQLGHTVSAYGIQDMGDGIFRIMIYDSNYPSLERFITIDAKHDTWRYLGSSLPTTSNAIYSGEGTFNPIRRIVSPYSEIPYHCDFCPMTAGDTEPFVRITTNGKTNIFIADNAGNKSGMDWKDGQTYDELEGVEFRRILGANSATFPIDKRYYLWLNAPDDRQWQRFPVSLTEPGSILTLTNALESYEYPTLTYQPANASQEIPFESYDVLIAPVALPEITYITINGEVETRVALQPELIADGKAVPNLNIFILHDEEQGIIGFEIYAANDSDFQKWDAFTLRFHGSIELFDKDQAETLSLDSLEIPLEASIDGSFFFNYLDWAKEGIFRMTISPDAVQDSRVVEIQN